MSEWIKVADRLPELRRDDEGEEYAPDVFVTHNYPYLGTRREPVGPHVGIARFTQHTKEWRFQGCNFSADEYVTHWMPFPDPATP